MISERDNGDVHIGGDTPISGVAESALIRAHFPMLAAACRGIAMTERAATMTLSASLAERRAVRDERFDPIIDDHSASDGYASDIQVALEALGATATGGGVTLPNDARGGTQVYHEHTAPEAPDFAIVSIAGCKRANGDVRIALGGIAPGPWRVNSSIEEDVSSGGIDDDIIETLAERALYDATPSPANAYKVDVAAALIRQTIGELA